MVTYYIRFSFMKRMFHIWVLLYIFMKIFKKYSSVKVSDSFSMEKIIRVTKKNGKNYS